MWILIQLKHQVLFSLKNFRQANHDKNREKKHEGVSKDLNKNLTFNFCLIICLSVSLDKQEGHDGPGSLTWASLEPIFFKICPPVKQKKLFKAFFYL